MRQGTILVHLDWPWVFAPEEVEPALFSKCEDVINKLHAAVHQSTEPVIAIKTPSFCQFNATPHHIQVKLDSLDKKTDFAIAASDNLEEVGTTAALQFPNVQVWKIGGFWRDLCCADIKYGVKEVSRAIIPHDWSVYVELRKE